MTVVTASAARQGRAGMCRRLVASHGLRDAAQNMRWGIEGGPNEPRGGEERLSVFAPTLFGLWGCHDTMMR